MILLTTIQRRLTRYHGSLGFGFDVRYMGKWIREYPQCFPKYVLKGLFQSSFIWNNKLKEFRWEIHKTKNV